MVSEDRILSSDPEGAQVHGPHPGPNSRFVTPPDDDVVDPDFSYQLSELPGPRCVYRKAVRKQSHGGIVRTLDVSFWFEKF